MTLTLPIKTRRIKASWAALHVRQAELRTSFDAVSLYSRSWEDEEICPLFVHERIDLNARIQRETMRRRWKWGSWLNGGELDCLAPCMPPAGLVKMIARLHSWHPGSQTDLSLASSGSHRLRTTFCQHFQTGADANWPGPLDPCGYTYRLAKGTCSARPIWDCIGSLLDLL